MAHLIRADPEDPVRIVTLQRSKLKPRLPSKKRVGRPRSKWAWGTLQQMWLQAKPTGAPAAYSPGSRRHNLFLAAAAWNRIF